MTLALQDLEIELKGQLSALEEEQTQIEEQLQAMTVVKRASGIDKDVPLTPEDTILELVEARAEPLDCFEITQELVAKVYEFKIGDPLDSVGDLYLFCL